MTDVNVQLAREFFELNGFRSMTYWQHDRVRTRGAEHGLQLFVENTAPAPARPMDFVLCPGDVTMIPRALVEVRPWHAYRMYASMIEANAASFEMGNEESRTRAKHVFGDAEFLNILVISELPASLESRQKSIELFRRLAIDHLIEFPLILVEILEKISPYVSYTPSQTLQTIRLLKRYNFVRFQQMEFAFHNEAPAPVSGPAIGPMEPADVPEEELLEDID